MKLAIEGHSTQGSEVIARLEMLGGINAFNLNGSETNYYYYIDVNNKIYRCLGINPQNYIAYTLEEFLEKFPYKVGDKVQHKGATSCGSIFEVEEMRWEENTIKYTLCLFGCNYKRSTLPAEYLQPYKEETMEESIDKTNKVIFDTQAQSCDIMNDIIKEDKEEIDIIEPITEINLNHPCFDEHNEIELIIPNGWKFEQRGNKMFGIRKQYPKTYEECCDILDIYPIYNKPNLCICEWHPETREMHEHYSKLANLSQKDIAFMILRICRDAYWKIAGDWEEKRKEKAMHYVICSTLLGEVVKDTMPNCIANYLLDFPTEEMRDAFYENFKDLIEQCKELL